MKRMLDNQSEESVEVFNLGTGRGLSVIEIIDIFQKVNGVEVPHKIVGRRDGDIERVWANPERANKVLGWTAVESIEETLRSAWDGAHLDRTISLVERDKNAPSVIIWSLGNEASNGDVFMKTYKWIKERDKTRPVQFEQAREKENTDIICPMLITV